jgi:hypothetical protein
MKLVTKIAALTIMLVGTVAYAYRPAPDVARDVVIEGYVEATSFSTGTTTTATGYMMVESVKVYVSTQTVIKTDTGYAKPSVLRIGTKVSVFGYLMKGGVMARTIYVAGK